MTSNGKGLEELVALVERTHAKSFTVLTGRRTYYEDGVQEAEFDVEVSGRVAGERYVWSIECRDRPSEGPANAAWIQQLAGRKLQFSQSRVTAVSTTGFTMSAKRAAKALGIELRVVESLKAESFRGWWPGFVSMSYLNQNLETELWDLGLAEDLEPELDAKARAFMAQGVLSDKKILKPFGRDELYSVDDAMHGFLREQNVWMVVPTDGTQHQFKFVVRYANDADHFLLPLNAAEVRVHEIRWAGKLRQTETKVRVADRREYREENSDRIISQVMTFEPFAFGGREPVNMELHRIGDPSEPNIVKVVFEPAAKPKQDKG